jgi:hypothetical protein
MNYLLVEVVSSATQSFPHRLENNPRVTSEWSSAIGWPSVFNVSFRVIAIAVCTARRASPALPNLCSRWLQPVDLRPRFGSSPHERATEKTALPPANAGWKIRLIE